MRPALCLALLTSCFAAAGAAAGVPFITDDPGTPVRGWEINLGLMYEKNRTDKVLTAPTLDINYSVDPHVQLNAYLGGVSVFGNQARSGASVIDTILKIKWRFLDDADDKSGEAPGNHETEATGPPPGMPMFAWLGSIATTGPLAVSIAPTVILPTGDPERGLGAGAYQLRLPVQIGKTLGDWYVYGEVAYQFGLSRTDGGRRTNAPVSQRGDALLYGVAVEYAVNDDLSIGAEINGARTLDAAGDYTLLANIGGSLNIGAGWALLGTIGRTLREDSRGGPLVLVQVFVQWTF